MKLKKNMFVQNNYHKKPHYAEHIARQIEQYKNGWYEQQHLGDFHLERCG